MPDINPADLTKEYIEKLIQKLQSEKEINNAVRAGQIIKVTRLVNKDGKEISVFSDTETLKTAKDLFDEKGNKREAVGSDVKMGEIEREKMDEKNNITKFKEDFAYIDTVDEKGNQAKSGIPFTYKNETRTKNEMNLYLRPDNLSDREKIALVAVYFDAASDIILSNRTRDIAAGEKLQKDMDFIQMTVANAVRAEAGFTSPIGYEPNPDMIAKLKNLLTQTKQIGMEAEFRNTLSNLATEIKELQGKIMGKRESTNELKTMYQIKHKFLESAVAKIDEYQKDRDFPKLSSWVQTVFEVETQRSKEQGKFYQMIEKLHDTVMNYELSSKAVAKVQPTPNLQGAGAQGLFGRRPAERVGLRGFQANEARQNAANEAEEKDRIAQPSAIKVGKR